MPDPVSARRCAAHWPARAPSGWTSSGAATTDRDAYLEFGGESVLTGLTVLAAITGEHFRLGTGRDVVWLGGTPSVSPTRAIAVGDGEALEDNEDICLISSLNRRLESSSLVTRVIPFGGGVGSSRATLALATRSESGYTVAYDSDTGLWYLRNDAAEATYGQIERVLVYPDVGAHQNDSYTVHPTMAANALFDLAYEYLRRHCQPAEFYSLEVVGRPAQVQPGDRMHVVYQEWVDGYAVVDINTYETGEPLYVTGVSETVTGAGVLVVGVEVGTVDRYAETDGTAVAAISRELDGVARGSAGRGGGAAVVNTIASG